MIDICNCRSCGKEIYVRKYTSYAKCNECSTTK